VKRTGLSLLLVALSVGCGVHGARSVARARLFPASEVALAEAPPGFEALSLAARDGVRVHALALPAPPGARTLVYFHNNRETIAARAWLARELRARGLGVVLVEYRGYGASRGAEPTEEGLYLDAEAALDHLASRGIAPDRVVLWGTSLGSGVAAEMARRGRGARLVLEAPYTSIPGLIADVAPFVPADLLVLDRFDTLSKSAEIRVPTLVMHGDADEIVPFWMGQRVAREIRGARLVRVRGAHHGDVFARDGARLLDDVVAFAS
jgi:fermentation-respiration switch protein FrsA (DUF1100 family)